jgi:phosphoenolpyruvate synthase/pyruvate phosphate dikinase
MNATDPSIELSEIVAPIFDERNAAVKEMIAQVIAVCRTKKRKIGICGQAPRDIQTSRSFSSNPVSTASLSIRTRC